jgi:hypothetical protein
MLTKAALTDLFYPALHITWSIADVFIRSARSFCRYRYYLQLKQKINQKNNKNGYFFKDNALAIK